MSRKDKQGKGKNKFKGLTKIEVVRQLKDVIYSEFICKKKKHSEIQSYIEEVAKVSIDVKTIGKYLSLLGLVTPFANRVKKDIPAGRADLLQKQIDGLKVIVKELEIMVEQQNLTIESLVNKGD